jgi:hypothetical protein
MNIDAGATFKNQKHEPSAMTAVRILTTVSGKNIHIAETRPVWTSWLPPSGSAPRAERLESNFYRLIAIENRGKHIFLH